MITLYGKRYAKNSKELVSTLFDGQPTANGLYKVNTKGIYFIDGTNAIRAFIRCDGLGPVSAYACKSSNGRTRYMFGLATDDAKWMGEPESYMAKCDEAAALAKSIFSA